MRIEEFSDQTSWQNFALSPKTSSLLQSLNWSEFQKTRQQKIRRLEVKDGEKIFSRKEK